jgi:CheY-like chemotaxis protein
MLSVAIIDSNPANIYRLTKILTSFGVTDIVSAEDGADGLRLIITEQPDMALVNVDLPTITGYSLAYSLSLEEELDVILVATTDYKSTLIKDEALNIGFREVMGFTHAQTELLNILGKYHGASA